MSRILLVYSSTDGQTLKICLRLKQLLEKQSHVVEVVSLDINPTINLNPFDKVVLGASIRYGKHRPSVYAFVKHREHDLNSKPNAFFSVNVVARKLEKSTPETNPYLIRFLDQIAWQPDELAVFAGKIDYKRYRFRDRLMIRIIMWITGGPTDPDTCIEFTDWQQVEKFGLTVSNM